MGSTLFFSPKPYLQISEVFCCAQGDLRFRGLLRRFGDGEVVHHTGAVPDIISGCLDSVQQLLTPQALIAVGPWLFVPVCLSEI